MAGKNEKEVQEFINQELGDWGESVLDVLEAKIRAKGLILSGELLRSLSFQLLKATSERNAHLQLIFQDAGRIKDMRQLRYKKMPSIESMESFVRKVGVDKFKFTPGYKKGQKIPTEDQRINRIAWGIAISRHKKNKRKPVKWFSKTFYGMVNELIESLLKGYQKAASDSITKSFNE